MLLSFSVTNFRSFREEQTLSMVASNRQPDHGEHLTPIPNDDHQALPVAAIYGANGAGKSNLVKALAFLQKMVVEGLGPTKKINRQPFAFDTPSKARPTQIEIQFIESGKVFVFGCRLTEQRVDAEWLSLLADGKETSVYERATDEREVVTIDQGPAFYGEGNPQLERLGALRTLGVLPNQLFLHGVGQNLRGDDQGPSIGPAWRWFNDALAILEVDSIFPHLVQLIASSPEFASFASDFLARAGTGVKRVQLGATEVGEGLLERFGRKFRDQIEQLTPGESAASTSLDGVEVLVVRTKEEKLRAHILATEHLGADGTRFPLPFPEESDGTKRLTHLLPALYYVGNRPVVMLVDEIDRSLHPLLAKHFVRDFLSARTGRSGQLIFTTHETTFLDLDLLRRDEIWFADKDAKTGATELYSLADYKVRTDLKIDKAYLQGRFEAVPPIEHELPDWVRHIQDELHPAASPSARKEPQPA